jgi:hypothetical protein
MQIGAYLYFRISGSNLNFEEITNSLNIMPCTIKKKGDIQKSKYGEFICEEDSWLYDYEIPEEQSLEDAIIVFTQPFLLKKCYIEDLSKTKTITLWVSLYPEGNQMNVNLSKKIISILGELNIEIDITTAYLSDFYSGKTQ